MAGYIGTIPVPQATQNREAFTATSNQTSFATLGYTPGFIDVYLNGVKLAAADYTATNGSDVVLASGAASGDILEVVAFSAFTVADQTFTGTTTAANLTVTGAFTSQGIDDNANATAITIDSSENVGIGTISPSSALDVRGESVFGSGTDGVKLTYSAGNSTGIIDTGFTSTGLEFRTGNSFAAIIDSSGSVGIGTSSVTSGFSLDVVGQSARFSDVAGDDGVEIGWSSASVGFVQAYDRGASAFRDLKLNNAVTITSSGNVGIKTDSPNRNLVVNSGSSSGYIQLANTNSGTGSSNGLEIKLDSGGAEADIINRENGRIGFWTNNTERMRITSAGGIEIPNQNAINELTFTGTEFTNVLSASTSGFQLGTTGAGYLSFLTSNAEAMRIDSSGRLLLGTPTFSAGNNGILGHNDGRFYATSTSQAPLNLNLKTSDGDIAVFSKDGAPVGSIGSVASGANLYMSAASGVGLGIGGDNLYPVNASGNSTDGALDIGDASARFKDLYLAGDIAHKDAAGNARLLYDKSANLLGNAGTNLYGAGIYLGGTGSANLLEDYEEGTWTPTAAGSTSGTMSISVPRARYIKIGQMVTASATISFTSGSTGVGGLRIFGLPGLPATTSLVNLETHGACMLDAVNFGKTYQTICCYIFSGANYLNLYGTVNNGSWEQLQVDPFINGTALQFTAIYQTNN